MATLVHANVPNPQKRRFTWGCGGAGRHYGHVHFKIPSHKATPASPNKRGAQTQPFNLRYVAVAGGPTNIGSNIVNLLLDTRQYRVFILSSNTVNYPASIQWPPPRARLLNVDFGDVDSLVGVLSKNKIHTVISAITMTSVDPSSFYEYTLARAARQSRVTKRFICGD
jgi:hypothetical protein